MADYRYQFGFIGMGNMGYAMLKGLLSRCGAEQVTFCARNREKMEDVAARTGVTPAKDNVSCASQSKYVVVAVKPQQLDAVAAQLKDAMKEDQILISVVVGISTEDLSRRFGGRCRVVRSMPNTPALVGEGMTGVCYDAAKFSPEELETVRSFFTSFGKMETVEERLMDAVSCASGSSPAYVYLFIEALADGVVKYGLPRAAAYEMVAQTVLGSAKMVLETGEHPGRLKDQVCSPGGTTIAGISALEECGFRNALIKATDACYDKCTKIK